MKRSLRCHIVVLTIGFLIPLQAAGTVSRTGSLLGLQRGTFESVCAYQSVSVT